MANKIFKVIYYLFFLVIGAIALTLILSAVPGKDTPKTFVVLSGSMEPAIKTGSVVVVWPEKEYKIGDIITFGPVTKTQPPFTHRIVEIRVQSGSPVYVTKGDANESKDQREVSQNSVLGKVVFNIPYLGYAVNEAKKPLGFMVIIVVPAVIIIYDELRKIWGEFLNIRKKKREGDNPEMLQK
ncbi:MAG: signal peptidase I [Patescibacteria group bacterium]|nr:signal peptidase I [Patescibacteria group bacterium]